MSIADARIQLKRDTTENWNSAIGMIPLSGEIIIYNDYDYVKKIIDGQIRYVNLPAIKIGDGQTYVQDLPFVNEVLRDKILEHIENPDIHVTYAEKMAWWNKLNVDDNSEIINGSLILNRN